MWRFTYFGLTCAHLDAGNEDLITNGWHAGGALREPDGSQHDIELCAGDSVISAWSVFTSSNSILSMLTEFHFNQLMMTG